MMVVRLLWEQIDWVRFPAARTKRGVSKQTALLAPGIEGLVYIAL